MWNLSPFKLEIKKGTAPLPSLCFLYVQSELQLHAAAEIAGKKHKVMNMSLYASRNDSPIFDAKLFAKDVSYWLKCSFSNASVSSCTLRWVATHLQEDLASLVKNTIG